MTKKSEVCFTFGIQILRLTFFVSTTICARETTIILGSKWMIYIHIKAEICLGVALFTPSNVKDVHSLKH